MMIITIAPRAIAIAVPATPELGKNFFPGFTNDDTSKCKCPHVQGRKLSL